MHPCGSWLPQAETGASRHHRHVPATRAERGSQFEPYRSGASASTSLLPHLPSRACVFMFSTYNAYHYDVNTHHNTSDPFRQTSADAVPTRARNCARSVVLSPIAVGCQGDLVAGAAGAPRFAAPRKNSVDFFSATHRRREAMNERRLPQKPLEPEKRWTHVDSKQRAATATR